MKPRDLLILAGILLLFGSPVLAACPDSHFNGVFVSTPTGGTTSSSCSAFGCNSSTVHFDIPLATLSAQCRSNGDASSGNSLYVVDDFNLGSVPEGTPAHVLVNMVVDGLGGFFGLGGGGGSASILDAVGGHADVSVSDNVHTTLVLAEDVVAGQPFRLTFYVGTSSFGEGSASVAGQFSFSNVPAGGQIVSCNGYASGQVVPVQAISWGRLKARYR
jgi:hypothetical protein